MVVLHSMSHAEPIYVHLGQDVDPGSIPDPDHATRETAYLLALMTEVRSFLVSAAFVAPTITID